MRALVTGGAGFIGSHLVDRLLEDGWQVVVVDDLRNGTVAPSPRHDLTFQREPAEQTFEANIAAVFHLAAPVGPVGVLGWAGKIAQDVIATSAQMARVALFNDCPLIDVSTSEVYGSGHADSETDVCTFRPEPSARKEYAVAKLAAETMLLNSRADVRIVRPFNVAGPRQRADGGFVLPRFVNQALTGRPLTVYQPGTQRRAFTHVLDIVDGLMAVLSAGAAGEVYNLGNPANECSILMLAAEVIDATGSSSPIETLDPTTLHGPAFREAPEKIPDITKARRDLGWQPRIDRAQTIADVVATSLVAV